MGRWTAAIALLAGTGCGGSDLLDEAGVCVDQLPTTAVAHEELVVIEGYTSGLEDLAETGVAEDDGQYAQLEAVLGALPPVDFDTHRVAWVAAWNSGSCTNMAIASSTVASDGPGAPPHFRVELDDPGGACAEACQAMDGALVMVAIETTATPTVCRALHLTCD